ncbi:MAG: response regulator [Candidatus Berkelbacteria bacterium]|nr:response regulator [Candidatus Berkelbacteria bacterium]
MPEMDFEIWLIDDTDFILSLLERNIKYNFPSCSTLTFETAAAALEKLHERARNGQKRPDYIVIDGQLSKDDQELARGENVVVRIRADNDNSSIFLIAFSSNPNSCFAMLKAGANLQVHKPCYDQIFVAIERQTTSGNST